MLALPRLTIAFMVTAVAALLLLVLTACQHSQPSAAKPPPPVKYSATYDREVKQIMELANRNRWEEAQKEADALYQLDPKNPVLARVQSWVTEQATQRRAQALEEEIRSIDAKNS